VLLSAHLAALHRPAWTLLVALGVTLGLASQAPRLRVLLSVGSLGERTLHSTRTQQGLRSAFEVRNELILLFAPETPGDALGPGAIARVRSWLEREERGDPEVTRVVSPFGLRTRRDLDGLTADLPMLDTGSREEMRELSRSLWGGVLTDSSGRDLAALLDLRDTPGGSRYGRFDPGVIGAIEARASTAFPPGSGVRVRLVGPAAFEYYSLLGIRWFRYLNVAMLLIVVLLLRVLLGTWRSGALLCGILVVTAACVAGGMAVTGAPIDLLSTGMFLILAVAALEDFLFLSYLQLHAGLDGRAAFRRMLLPSLFTSLTTVIGFWSLGTSDLAVVRRLGLWAGVGAGLEWAVTFLVLPAFVARFGAWRRWVSAPRAWTPRGLDALVRATWPRGLAFASLVVFALGTYGALHLSHNDSLPRLFDGRHPYRQGFEYLQRERGFEGFVHVILPAADDRARNEAVLAGMAALPSVARVLDPYAVMDSGLGATGMVPSEIEALNPGAMARLRGFFSADGRVRGIVYLRHIDSDSLRASLLALRQRAAAAGGDVAGDLVTYSEFHERVPATLYSSLCVCLVLVAAVLVALMALLRVGGAWAVLASSFWGVAVMLTALWATRLPLSFLTCGFASVLVGLTGDNVIQYLFARADGRLDAGVRARAGASIQVSVLMALASLVFLGSAFVPSRRLGLLLAAGFVVTLAGDLWLLKALWRPGPAVARAEAVGRVS